MFGVIEFIQKNVFFKHFSGRAKKYKQEIIAD